MNDYYIYRSDLQILFTIAGPLYINPVHTCTSDAPVSSFSAASLPAKNTTTGNYGNVALGIDN